MKAESKEAQLTGEEEEKSDQISWLLVTDYSSKTVTSMYANSHVKNNSLNKKGKKKNTSTLVLTLNKEKH